MNKKRILFLSHVSPVIHGQAFMAAQLVEIMKSWPEAEVKVINTCYADERADLGGFSFSKLVRWFGFLARAFGALCAGRVDIVLMTHSFFPGPFLKDSAFLWLARLFGKPAIVWVHMDPARFPWQTASPLLSAYARRVVRLPHRWVACAPSLLRQWPEVFEREKMTAVCNGIPDPANKVFHRSGDGLRVVFLSSMTPEKGWRELFAAAEILCAEMPDVSFDFHGGLGAQESRAGLLATFANSTHPDRIRWHGEAKGDEKFTALGQADLFCMPSWTEAFPLVILEAMACGLPVIASKVGGIPDAIEDGINGWLFAPRDLEGLRETLRTALRDQEQLRRIGRENRRKFLDRFSCDAFANHWREILMQA
jgi:glycosyltransferase involved in cell wall biosynthesis